MGSSFKDKFEILWGKVPYQTNEPATLTSSKIFPVHVEHNDMNGEDFLKGIDI